MRLLIGFCLTIGVSLHAVAGPLIVKYIGNNSGVREDYYLELLDTALKITEPKFGSYKIEVTYEALSSERKHELLVNGERVNVDRIVGFHKPSGPRAALLYVDTPLLGGFMGYRIPLIRRGTQTRFDDVKSMADLKRFSLGLGKGWEGNIYQYNGFNLYEPINFEMLLKMLAGGRYDFVPLSAIEIEESYKIKDEDLSLTPEQHLLIHTPLPNYFYVSPQSPMLATRLRIGLKQIQADGRMKKIFDKYFSERLQKLHLNQRRIIEIPNPENDGSLPDIADELANY